MTKLKVYRFEFEDRGDSFIAIPAIPETVGSNEDQDVERICVCPYILGCIRSLELPGSIIVNNENWTKSILHLYCAKIPVEELKYMMHQPCSVEVGDEFITGELWITKPTEFIKEAEYELSKQFDIPNTVYSRFQMAKRYPNGFVYDLPPDRIVAPVIYGDKNAFSFIGMDPRRREEAYNYANENPYIP